MTDEFSLTDITPGNWRQFTRLETAESQRGQVASNVLLLARARGICKGGEAIGLLLQREYEQDGKRYCTLDQFMIDQQFQGRGYGRAVMHLWLEEVRQAGRFDAVNLCYVDGHDEVRRFYERLGFNATGADGNEIVMELRLG